MAEPTPLFPRKKRWPSVAVAAAGATSLLVFLLMAGDQPQPQHAEWAEVTKALESDAWPLVRAARYDPANHFVLIDLHAGVAPQVAERLACEDVRQLVDHVDSTAGFALYAAPDRLVIQRNDCAV